QGFDDDEEATLSAATTPSLPPDAEPKLEMCYCCPSHAEQPPEVASDDPKYCFALPVHITQASPEHARPSVRRAHDPISPRMQKQISLFECGGAEASAMRASINLPAAAQQLRQDARLRKFENLTQSTSNSNFPFESNTLKRAPLVSTKDDYANVSHTQSCINLKSSGSGSLDYGSPQHQQHQQQQQHREKERDKDKERQPSTLASTPNYNRLPNALSVCCSLDVDVAATATSTAAGGATTVTSAAASASASSAADPPHPGALIVKERFIEPPKRGIVRGYHGKTQSMDADFLFNEFLLLPAMAPQLDDDLDVEQVE
ncbi:hypothetical protein KR044_003141, partial [Drosophila immigrans]